MTKKNHDKTNLRGQTTKTTPKQTPTPAIHNLRKPTQTTKKTRVENKKQTL